METTRTALVLGATGGVGGSIARALVGRGWHVRGLARDVAAARRKGIAQIEWVAGDALERADVISAAHGASVIVHGVNPPKYKNWDKLVLPMIDNTIAAARAAGGARIVLPGTIYNYDVAKTPVISADTPQQAKSRKGKIRVALEQRLEQAAPDVPALIVRAGDFFGPGVGSSWFAQGMVMPGKPLTRIINPARGGGHSWAYLPDLTEAIARLLEAPDRLQPFERLGFEGFYDASGTALIDAIGRVVGRKLPVYRFPWWLMTLMAPFGGFPREVAEIAPVWRYPARFDNGRLEKLIGSEPRTPLDDAIRDSLIDMGCLKATSMPGSLMIGSREEAGASSTGHATN